jgi:hypothetical protein
MTTRSDAGSAAGAYPDSVDFDILEWYPAYQSCQRYFVTHSQNEPGTRALCALINIRLPYQNPAPSARGDDAYISLLPYMRRLVVTGFDRTGILHGLFGDDWAAGVGPLRDCERRNYLFAAKHGGWRSCKKQYDMAPDETVPFMRPLRGVGDEELHAAERDWSAWLLLEDWMIGPRAPAGTSGDEGRDERGQMAAFSFDNA